MTTPLPPSAITAAQSVAAGTAPRAAGRSVPADVKEVAQEFEAFFLSQMLEHMFAGIEVDGMFGGGYGEGVYRSLMIQEYGKTLSKAGGIGIADMVGRELMRLQEAR
jgi:flagellar protein FlgJ